MINMTYCRKDGENHVTTWSPAKGDPRPCADFIQLKEVLQIDVCNKSLQLLKRDLPGLPVAKHRSYTRYQGDLAKFVWDNL